MLVKLLAKSYAEDFGVLGNSESSHAVMYENGPVRLTSRMQPEVVVRVTALWMDRDIKVHCKVAASDVKKRQGLQGHSLAEDAGMFFPYPGYADVAFHQGSVPYSLDVIFLRDYKVAKVESSTIVGSDTKWTCDKCDGVIEVHGGFCSRNSIEIGDALALMACSSEDLGAYQQEKAARDLEIKQQSLLQEIMNCDV